MPNSFTYWRATHPLVFISTHLLIGVGFAYDMPVMQNKLALYLSISLFMLSFIFLFIITNTGLFKKIDSLLISLILVSWGMGIKWANQSNHQIYIPYPESFIQYCRQWIIEKIEVNIKNNEAKAFSLAILIGIKSDMNKDLINAYIQLGIIHIIAISGMHIDILFKNLSNITRFLPRKILFLWIELCFLLFVAWTYTLVAFASPSIIRASVFFSIYIIGKFIGTPSLMLNTIAGGLLIMLLFNESKITNIGLQLSYAAVMGIHLFYKPISKLLIIENPIIQFFWSNCCVSLSAQITTFPILIFHFHQIASWVLVSNFLMVPLSNLILYGLGVLLILPNQLSITSFWGSLIEKYIICYNEFVTIWFKKTNAANVLIHMNSFDLMVYYTLLLLIYLWLYLKQNLFLIWILGIICIYTIVKLFS